MRSGFQAFLAGFIFPALAFIFLTVLMVSQGTFYFFRLYPLHLLPIIWGVWDVLYYYFGRHVIFLKKIGVWGGILGFFISLIGIFQFNTLAFYQKYFFTDFTIYNVLIMEVLIYFISWELFVRNLNRILID